MWIQNKKDEDTLNQPNTVNTPTVGAGGGAEMGGSTSPATGNFSTTSPVTAQQPVQKWATAQDYLKANQPQATQLGEKVQTSLTGKLGEQKGAIDTAAQSAQSAITSGSTAFNPDVIKTAVERPTELTGTGGASTPRPISNLGPQPSYKSGSGENNQAYFNWVKQNNASKAADKTWQDSQAATVKQNTEGPLKLQNFLNQWNASYKGPESLESTTGYTDASKAATGAKEISENLGSSGGRKQILQDQFGVYGAGNQSLDQALLGTAENYDQIQELAPKFSGLKDYLGQKSSEVGGAAQAAQKTTQATKDQSRAAFEGHLDKFQKDLASRVGTSQADAQAKTQQYLATLATGDVTKVAADLRAAGITEAQIKPIIDNLTILNKQYKANPDLSAGYSYNPATGISAQNVATPEDYAKAQAWAQLTGEQGYTTTLNPADASKAGMTTKPETGFLPDYLKQQTGTLVGQKDKHLLENTAVKLADVTPITKKVTTPEEFQEEYARILPIIQNYANAAKRQGIKVNIADNKTWPAGLKALSDQYGQLPGTGGGGPGAYPGLPPMFRAMIESFK